MPCQQSLGISKERCSTRRIREAKRKLSSLSVPLMSFCASPSDLRIWSTRPLLAEPTQTMQHCYILGLKSSAEPVPTVIGRHVFSLAEPRSAYRHRRRFGRLGTAIRLG